MDGKNNETIKSEPFDQCYKHYGDLTAKDWLAVGRKLKIPVDDMKKTKTKGELIKFIYDSKQEWFNELDITADRIYFFKFNAFGFIEVIIHQLLPSF